MTITTFELIDHRNAEQNGWYWQCSRGGSRGPYATETDARDDGEMHAKHLHSDIPPAGLARLSGDAADYYADLGKEHIDG